MAKIQILTKSRRGKAICSKCGKEILPGEKYNKATPFRRKPIVRCIECGIKPYETSCSSYVKWAGSIVNNWEKMYPIDENVIDDLVSDIESIKDDIENNLYNLPEQFQYDSILQDRLNSLEDCLNILETIDISFYDNLDDEEDNYENELKANENGLRIDINTALSSILMR